MSLFVSQKIRKKPPTPKRIQPAIRHDSVSPEAYNRYNLPWACEDCTHYNSEDNTCTLGYHTKWHRRDYQRESYELSGKMALCRFQEID
jgi:hypothetical protein